MKMVLSIYYFNSSYFLLFILLGDSELKADGDFDPIDDFEFSSDSPLTLAIEDTLNGSFEWLTLLSLWPSETLLEVISKYFRPDSCLEGLFELASTCF